MLLASFVFVNLSYDKFRGLPSDLSSEAHRAAKEEAPPKAGRRMVAGAGIEPAT